MDGGCFDRPWGKKDTNIIIKYYQQCALILECSILGAFYLSLQFFSTFKKCKYVEAGYDFHFFFKKKLHSWFATEWTQGTEWLELSLVLKTQIFLVATQSTRVKPHNESQVRFTGITPPPPPHCSGCLSSLHSNLLCCCQQQCYPFKDGFSFYYLNSTTPNQTRFQKSQQTSKCREMWSNNWSPAIKKKR